METPYWVYPLSNFHGNSTDLFFRTSKSIGSACFKACLLASAPLQKVPKNPYLIIIPIKRRTVTQNINYNAQSRRIFSNRHDFVSIFWCGCFPTLWFRRESSLEVFACAVTLGFGQKFIEWVIIACATLIAFRR